MKPDILRFIQRFAGAEQIFLNGCCYWFSFILHSQFGGKIAYDPIDGHFITVIDGNAYDIRGEVTDLYKNATLLDWECYKKQDPLHTERIERDCVRMERC